ncbi:MAG: TadA family conjugal transfer-associated ATPase [Terrimesophilobacter sp.]
MTPITGERFVAVRPHDTGGVETSRIDTALSVRSARETVDRHPQPLDQERSLPEFGTLAPLLSDPAVTDVFVNGAGEVWIDRGDGAERRPSLPFDEAGVRELAVRLIALGGRHIDEASPCIDVRLRDGIRVHAVLPPISPAGSLLSIRLPRVRRLTIDDLVAAGFFDTIAVQKVLDLVRNRANILVTGAGGSGKTTLLSALLALAPPTDRLIAIEDVAELHVDHPHFVSLEARQPNLEGAGEVGLARLVREALRMRPDRLILGECRGAEVRELLSALNTGHDGGAGTLHANSLSDVPARLEALGALAGLGVNAVARQSVSAIGAVLHVERHEGVRRLAQMGRLAVSPAGRLVAESWEGQDAAST